MIKYFHPVYVVPVLAAFIVGIVGNRISEYLAGPWEIVLLIVAVIFVVASVWMKAREETITVSMSPPITLRLPVDKERYAKKGIIVFVSLYKPMGDKSTAKNLGVNGRCQAAKQNNYKLLDLPNSNLGSAITSIITHRSRLEHCWLIATETDKPEASSITYLPVLETYLEEVEHMACEFHQTTIPFGDDAQVVSKSRDLVKDIFRQSEEFNLAEQDIVADITGGTRSVILGMILACQDEKRDVQLVGTTYDGLGNPDYTHPFPMLFSFETKVEPR